MSNIVHVKSKEILLTKIYKHALAIRLYEEERSRMRTADHLMKHLNELRDKKGEVIVDTHYNLRLHSELVYDAFGEDMAFTWVTDVKRFAHTMPKRRSSMSQLLRFQIFDCIYKITKNPIRLPDGFKNWKE